MIQQLYSIARNTFIESIRQPVFLVLLLLGIMGLVLNTAVAAYTLDDDNKLMIDMGLSVLLVFPALVAAFTAAGVINREIENRTVLTVVSKPISRPVFIVGKFLGIAAALAVCYWVLSLVFLLCVRHGVFEHAGARFDMPAVLFGTGALLLAILVATAGNYFYRWVFTSSVILWLLPLITLAWLIVLVTSRHWQYQSPLSDLRPHGQLLLGLALVFQGLLILTAIAVAASTRLGQVMTLVACAAVAVVGLISDYYLGTWAQRSAFGDVLYRLTPNFQMFWPADALTESGPAVQVFSGAYMLQVGAYALLLVLAILALAVALFQTREVG